MTHDELRDEVEAAIEESGRMKKEIAEELGLHESSVSNALRETGGHVSKRQVRILELLTPYTLQKKVLFRAERSEKSGDEKG